MRDDALRARLRRAAREHSPDRARMLARIERGMSEPAAPAAPAPERPGPAGRSGRGAHAAWPRVVGVTAAVTGVLVAGGYGAASGLRDDPPAPGAAAATPGPTHGASRDSGTGGPEADRSPGAPESRGAPDSSDSSKSSKASGNPKSPAPPEPSTSERAPERGPRTVPAGELLWADGSIDPGSTELWSQSDITVKAKKPLAALTVELRLSPRDRPEDTGNWRTRPADDFDVSVSERDGGGLVYRWTLKEGRTVPPGEHVFAGQYGHAEGGRDADADSYTVRAATAGPGEGERAVWKGDFA